MNDCSNLYLLSLVACQLSECLSEQQLEELASNLQVLSDLLTNILIRNNNNK
ncbi:MAG: hypothetical protein HFI34_01110 [Lachnospiraceae bacterium]|nr:hypothetical protein [Lachnospiraceae bacterium]